MKDNMISVEDFKEASTLQKSLVICVLVLITIGLLALLAVLTMKPLGWGWYAPTETVPDVISVEKIQNSEWLTTIEATELASRYIGESVYGRFSGGHCYTFIAPELGADNLVAIVSLQNVQGDWLIEKNALVENLEYHLQHRR